MKIRVQGLSKSFTTRTGEVLAVEGAGFEVAEKQFVTIVGTSGCGKSTVLNILAGLQPATTGQALVDGAPVTGPSRDRGVVFQAYTLFPWMTALRNIEFALRAEPISRAERRTRARRYLDLVGLEDFGDALPSQLSGGMRQRVAIARSLSYQPSILLMDEPFGALDALTRQSMQELLTDVWEQHRLTVVFVTHDVEEAVYISDRVLVMTKRPGRIKEDVVIPLPRPRRHEHLTTPEFLATKTRILESLREEGAGAGVAP
jgi:NitT/TauT family transport system ATP-binding protein